MTGEMATPPRWRVHLPTADQTCVRLALPRLGERAPWPLARVLAELASLGATPTERTRALGSGRGTPVIASSELRWHGCPLAVESFHDVSGGAGELAISAPSWDELTALLPGEDAYWELIDTTADASVSHYVLGAVAIAAVGAIHYWWPQVLTRPLREGLGRLTALVLLLGVFALALPDLISGLLDERRGSLGQVRDGVEALNLVSFIGGLLVVLAVLLFIVNLAVSLASRRDEDVIDPWDGYTLEWAADPVAVVVESPTPMLDAKEASDGGLG